MRGRGNNNGGGGDIYGDGDYGYDNEDDD
jgi:hypothetical protein